MLVLEVHEEEDHQQGLGRGHGHGREHVQVAEVEGRHPHRDPGQDQQGQPDFARRPKGMMCLCHVS